MYRVFCSEATPGFMTSEFLSRCNIFLSSNMAQILVRGSLGMWLVLLRNFKDISCAKFLPEK